MTLLTELDGLSPAARNPSRPLKILHVGNVAQNGYINASILNARGHDCDLVAPDLYHVACSPEWYELTFADVDAARLGGDPFFPDFYALGREMPCIGDWVAQGPFLTALQYLLLKRRKDPRAHAALSTLAYMRFKATVQRTTVPFLIAMEDAEFWDHLARYDLRPQFRRRIVAGRMADRYYNWVRNRVSLQAGSSFVEGWHSPMPRGTLDQFFSADPALSGVVRGLRALGLTEAFGIEFIGPLQDFEHLAAHGFNGTEAGPYGVAGLLLRDLAAHYDLCIFYGDSCKFAFVAGIERYWALEHGTIRTVPFDTTIDGRLVEAAYLNATKVFLTNTDYATAEKRLEFTPEQKVFSPHPFDEVPATLFRSRHTTSKKTETIVFFCPARQDWQSRDPKMAKGNDAYFHAGRILLDKGHRNFQFHCIDWGIDREASRDLIASLGLTDHVRWSPIMGKRMLWASMLDAHAVIDQFLISVLSGTGFEALALGCRLITNDDGIGNKTFFAEPPPILAAADAESIATQLWRVMEDPNDLADIGQAGAYWVAKYHSADRMHSLLMTALDTTQNDATEGRATSLRTPTLTNDMQAM